MADDNQIEDKEQLSEDVVSDDVSDPAQLQQDLEAAIAKSEENLSGWKRTQADFENYKRRQQQEAAELVDFTRVDAFRRLLPVLDSLEQALKHIPELDGSAVVSPFMGSDEADKSGNYHTKLTEFSKRYQNWQVGISGLLMQLDKTLEEMGIKKIEAVGKKFDPHFHEAVKEIESEAEDGIVVDELQSGFEMNGKVIRPSQVVISKN